MTKTTDELRNTAGNSTFAIGGVSCSADSLVVAESFVLRIKFSGKKPAHRKSANRCAKVSAPLQLLHIGARITSVDVLKRFPSRKNLQYIYGLAKFPQESKLSEETSPIRAPLAEIRFKN